MAQFPPHEKGGSHQDIENGGVDVPGSSESLNVAPPSLELMITIISIVWMIVAFLLNLSYPISDGNKVLNALYHQHKMSFYSIVMISVAAFYSMSVWMMMIVGRYRAPIARNLILIILVLGVLASTVLLYALLPEKSSWIVWFFFALTIWVMLDMQECQRVTQLKGKICKPVEEGCKWATRWTIDKIHTLYGYCFCCLPIHSPSCRTSQMVVVILIIIFV
ncbi:uncharacterized protein LOC131258035 isoform X2 [Magnolia sinica]|uniref:uncharacterized protein LOC131258035 isoform X2 n=1 Tax=Magnolia sinica TaxID=86752 RepID=UPI00265A9C71|nr:uncharacterized protein LOC131258035 isoform X2 [Magnolia sinica]XP_058115047.1 uncharacterized protein LOC131258035 isoform X2 [Magnolia sinica]